jgi:hypothetical protein
MLHGWLARMCRFTYGLLTEDGLRNTLYRNGCLEYMTSMSKETLWLCVLVYVTSGNQQYDVLSNSYVTLVASCHTYVCTTCA